MVRIFFAIAIAASVAIANAQAQMLTNAPVASAKSGRALFLKNCAHCHAADASGDEGPDLHDLDWTDKQIADRIRNGKKGQMTAFAGKLKTTEIESLIAYLHALNTNSPAKK
jgi:cytochrome c oxidase cbb3-type subunit III